MLANLFCADGEVFEKRAMTPWSRLFREDPISEKKPRCPKLSRIRVLKLSIACEYSNKQQFVIVLRI
jgi:hypothetical protein